MQPMLNTALSVARQTGKLIERAFDDIDLIDVESKGTNDYVTQVDRVAEASLIEGIRKRYPNHGFLCEESGLQEGTGDGRDHIWVIDPLDGTTNFIHGVPHFAISIALKVKGQLEVGLVYDPVKKEEFTAVRGRGAQLNGKRIRVTDRKQLEGTLLATGFPFRPDQQGILDTYMAIFRDLAITTAGIRRQGAAALDLAYVAAGRYDGFWEFGLNEWDIAAGLLLVKEAGGLSGDLKGGMKHLETGDVACAPPKLFKPLMQTICRHTIKK
ncbi:MAG: inositol monophosphatase family protein [Ketobacteraceae bacterium]|nr:inositol monophosphatase family protein [Ketobacteraceae bacterium]